MIAESARATPYGIFLLADDYLDAASVVREHPRIGQGPVRLLALHAAELFLKTYMRSAGETVDALRGLGYDLDRMVERATKLGLELPPQILDQSRKLSLRKDYVRVRYVVSETSGAISKESVIRYCQTIRASVTKALDMDDTGVPRGLHWLGEPPSDYPVQDKPEGAPDLA